jgi:hypothetical protein
MSVLVSVEVAGKSIPRVRLAHASPVRRLFPPEDEVPLVFCDSELDLDRGVKAFTI